MKIKNLLHYFAIILLLLLFFQHLYYSQNLKKVKNNLKIENNKNQFYLDSLKKCNEKMMENNYFSLEENEESMSYFDKMDIKNVAQKIQDALYDISIKNNNFIPYEGIDSKFLINKVKILNHKWIIADFSDGKYWGELFITYKIESEEKITFKVVNYFLYLN